MSPRPKMDPTVLAQLCKQEEYFALCSSFMFNQNYFWNHKNYFLTILICLPTVKSSQCCHHLVLWYTGSHLTIIIFIVSNFISLLLHTLRKSKMYFFGYHNANFQTSSLDFLELIFNPPRASLAASQDIQPPAWPSQGWYDLSRLKPDGHPWVSLVLSAFGCLTALRIIRSEWSRSKQSPLAWGKIPLERLSSMVDIYYLLCIYCIFCFSFFLHQ